jgi:hypothetical protein
MTKVQELTWELARLKAEYNRQFNMRNHEQAERIYAQILGLQKELDTLESTDAEN